MLTWLLELLPHALTVVLLVAVSFLPGLLVLLPLKPGLPAAIALGPAISLLIFLAGSLVTDSMGVPWNAATAALTAVPPVLAAWLIGRRFSLRSPLCPAGLGLPVKLAVGVGVAIGSVVTCLALLRGIGDPATVSQGWDPIFHLNVLRWIQESGSATPWGVAPIFGAGRPTYYPTGWHSFVSLVPGSLTETANLSSLVIGGIIWPIGLTFLASAVLPRHPVAWALTPLFAASFVSFPYSQLLRSGQWPNGLATALVPAAVALCVLILRRLTSAERASTPAREHVLPAAVLAAVLGGCVAAHPSAVFATAVAVLPFVAAGLLPLFVRGARSRPWRAVAAAGASIAAAAAAYSVLADSRVLAGVMAYPRAVRAEVPDSLLLAFFDLPRFPALSPTAPDDFNLAVGLLVILGGAAAVLIRDARPLAVSWLAFVALYVLAAGPETALRWLTGFWYKDTQRIAPFIAMTGSLLAALAIAVLARAAHRAVSARLPSARTVGRRTLPAILVALSVAVVTCGMYWGSGSYRSVERVAVAAQNYVVSDKPGTGVLSRGEQDFIQRSGAMLPADAVVIGDPFNGETYFYALTGRHVVYTQLGSPTSGSPAKELLRTGFNRLATDKSICKAVLDVGATHFYEDVPGASHGSASLKRWPGFYNVPTGRGLEKVASADGRTLYKITACG
ncbi:DUF6541 family protein [Pseudarthrobacter sulfonivorans]|uniref:DUF6541 family protein n=1 Tax=Pseudarthrobacter sulfonivorans TaxID=121292 RepID=UPI0028627191|nr:DUF6541 family protein [Pseudarthrobacter sulfonivorans]MDR6413430.1 hypothetical protein [Pseudarthrobacter sulfonivorans]